MKFCLWTLAGLLGIRNPLNWHAFDGLSRRSSDESLKGMKTNSNNTLSSHGSMSYTSSHRRVENVMYYMGTEKQVSR